MDVTQEGDLVHYTSKQHQHWYGDYADGPREYFQIRDLNIYPIEDIIISFRWKDQGWGNLKGMLYLNLHSDDGTLLLSRPLSENVALHNWTDVNISFNSTDEIVSKYETGYYYEISRYVGGGGGHELFINDFDMQLKEGGVGLK